MKFYEIYLILKPTLKEEEIEGLKKGLAEILQTGGFKIASSETKLAEHLSYHIGQYEHAHTLALQIVSNEDRVIGPEPEHWLKYNENVLRQVIFSKNEKELKRTKPVSVIDQLRQRERRAFTMQPVRGGSRATGETSRPSQILPPHEVDVEAINKKLEELLK